MNEFYNQTFQNTRPELGDYESCRFVNCDMSEMDLSDYSFTDCEFEGCNLSMAIFKNTSVKQVLFNHCKMLGVNLSVVNPFLVAMNFEHCILNLASFYKLKLKGTRFIHCQMHETDFVEADLSMASFESTDLSGARFENTNFEKCDLRYAVGYSINPNLNRLKKTRVSREGLHGFLHQVDLLVEG